tara:strand:- start:5925 stop:6950 length:1026 start_codon:yes stop_codon:yes gene_type:complete
MREWFLSSELTQLDTMPGSVAGISKKAKKEEWKSRKAKGGGRSLEYHISNFEDVVQYQLYCNEYGNTDYKEWEIEQAILKTGAVEQEDVNAVIKAVKQGMNLDELIAYWVLHGYPSEKRNTSDFPPKNHANDSNEQLKSHEELTQEKLKAFDTISEEIGIDFDTLLFWDEQGALESNIKKIKAKKLNQADAAVSFSLSAPDVDQLVSLQFFDIDVSAGSGSLALQEDKSDPIAFDRSFLINSLDVLPDDVFLMPVRGDSMYPTLKNQAIIMVKKIDIFAMDGIYVFRYNGQLMVKRLQFSKSGLTIVSDNPTYKTWELTGEEVEAEDFEILGEVIWSGQRM